MRIGTTSGAPLRRFGGGAAVGALVVLAVGCRDYTCHDTATCPLGDAGAEVSSTALDRSTGEDDNSTDRVSNELGDDAATADPVTTGSSSEDQRSGTSDVLATSQSGPTTAETSVADFETSENLSTSSPAAETNAGSTGGHDASASGVDLEPPGYWRQDEWQGCVWTAIEGEGTSMSPQDFTHGAEDGYCVAGNVAATEGWLGAALLGFNLKQAHETAVCDYVPLDVNAARPPGVIVTKQGLAVNFIKRGADNTFTLRAQIWGPNGATDPNDRWCVGLAETQGKTLIPWSHFNTECWAGGEGVAYNGQPISAVTFLVPGNGWPDGTSSTAAGTPFDFCITGIAAGDTPDDAPGTNTALKGVIGGTASGADFERVKVSAGGKSYIIQNNNWGNPNTSDQTISFVNNSFTVTDGPDGSASCQGCPLSFPSIYIGASGNTQNGQFSTRTTDNLPVAISAITSVNTSVRWSGNPGAGASASYDIWFAKPSRNLTNQRYNDGLDGFIMLWLYDPPNAQPIGSDVADVTINGITWDVWVGPRGEGPSGGGADLPADPNAPVISYVAKATTNTFNGDLKPFFADAMTRSNQFTSDLLLTDVFFGFEIWSGGLGLKVDSFEVDVQR